MAEQAIVLIPDISGFTVFTRTTEIDHAAHIITELLEVLVESNETDFTLAEIEGDAAVYRDFHENHALYSENVEVPENKLTLQAHYEMESLDDRSTRLRFNVNWMGAQLPAENKKGMMAGQAANFELLKAVCEKNPA